MRIKHSEQKEFISRFHCATTADKLHSVRVEFETASGDLAAVTYASEGEFSKASDWLSLFRTAREVNALDHPVSAARFAGVPQDGPTAWTFESHRRNCPRCGRRIMKAATLCGYCWAHLDPERVTPEMSCADEGPVYRDADPSATPELRRACASCGKMIMAEAARCGHCWARAL